MNRLAVAYQAERPNVEVSDLTVLVIQALGLLVSRLVNDHADSSEGNDSSDIKYVKHFLLTTGVTSAAHLLIGALELDFNPDYITSIKIGRALGKMRLPQSRQNNTGKRGWLVSLADVIRWGKSYGMDPHTMPGLNLIPHHISVTPVNTVTPVKPSEQRKIWEGEL